MAIRIELAKTKQNSYELKAVAIIKDLKGCDHSMTLINNFNSTIEKMKQSNHVKLSHVYKGYFDYDNGKAEVWHLNLYGEKDRLIATIFNEK